MKKIVIKICISTIFSVFFLSTCVFSYNIEVKPGRLTAMPNSDIAFRVYVSGDDISKKNDKSEWNYSNGKNYLKVGGKLELNEIYFHLLPNVEYKYDSKVENYGYVNYLSIVNDKDNKNVDISKLPLTVLNKIKSENILSIDKNAGFKEYRYRNENENTYAVDYTIPYNKFLELLNKARI